MQSNMKKRGSKTVSEENKKVIREDKEIVRKVYYYYVDGSEVIDINGKHAIAIQSALFSRNITFDGATGKKTYEEWPKVTFGAIEVAEVQGYYPNMNKIPEARDVSPDAPPADVNIYFSQKKVDADYIGFRFEQGRWVHYLKGEVDVSYKGLKKTPDGNWYYFSDGIQDITYNGIAKNQYGWYYINNGEVDLSVTGLVRDRRGWYYADKGLIDRTVTAFMRNENGCWYVNSGKVDYSFTGILKIKDDMRYLVKGKVCEDFSGEITYKDKNYIVRNGIAELAEDKH